NNPLRHPEPQIPAFLFFSSRRRHTRWPRDWSSDVCSSDLKTLKLIVLESPITMREIRNWENLLEQQEMTPKELMPRGRKTNQERSEERRVGKEWRCRRAR